MPSFGELRSLVEHLDLGRVAQLAKKVDVRKLLSLLAQLEPADLAHLAARVRAKQKDHPLPAPDGDFYDLGGDSLAAARILTGVRKRFGVSITLDRLHEVQTVRAMAACVEAARSTR